MRSVRKRKVLKIGGKSRIFTRNKKSPGFTTRGTANVKLAGARSFFLACRYYIILIFICQPLFQKRKENYIMEVFDQALSICFVVCFALLLIIGAVDLLQIGCSFSLIAKILPFGFLFSKYACILKRITGARLFRALREK